MKRGSASDASVSATTPGCRSGSTAKAAMRTATIESAACDASAPTIPRDRSITERRRGSSADRRRAARAGSTSALASSSPSPTSSNPFAISRAIEVGRLIVRRQRPEVRLPPDRREQHADLGEPPVEARRVRRATGSPRCGSRTARARPDRGEAAHRRGHAAFVPGSRGPRPRGATAGARRPASIRGRAPSSPALMKPSGTQRAYRRQVHREVHPGYGDTRRSRCPGPFHLAVAAALLLIVSACSSSGTATTAPHRRPQRGGTERVGGRLGERCGVGERRGRRWRRGMRGVDRDGHRCRDDQGLRLQPLAHHGQGR